MSAATILPGLEREARDTAARAVARARAEGLHGRVALAATAASLAHAVRYLLGEDDPDVRRWERALQLVEDRWRRVGAASAEDVEPEPGAGAEVVVHAPSSTAGLAAVRYRLGGPVAEPSPTA